jgi:Domain of unknown function (DUF4333)
VRGLVVVASLALALALGAASPPLGAATLNPRPIRDAIAQQVKATYPDLQFGNVACPDGVRKKQGGRFACMVQLPGAFLRLDVTETDAAGALSFETAQAVLQRQAVEMFVAANASVAATVTCGSAPWLVVKPGTQIACHANLADGASRDVQVLVRNTAGDVAIAAVT